ncbi:MAG: hypothetical protein AVDCRST_MAG53-869, partial [uncultured Solirubrobacteraceae bacterium]
DRSRHLCRAADGPPRGRARRAARGHLGGVGRPCGRLDRLRARRRALDLGLPVRPPGVPGLGARGAPARQPGARAGVEHRQALPRGGRGGGAPGGGHGVPRARRRAARCASRGARPEADGLRGLARHGSLPPRRRAARGTRAARRDPRERAHRDAPAVPRLRRGAGRERALLRGRGLLARRHQGRDPASRCGGGARHRRRSADPSARPRSRRAGARRPRGRLVAAALRSAGLRARRSPGRARRCARDPRARAHRAVALPPVRARRGGALRRGLSRGGRCSQM